MMENWKYDQNEYECTYCGGKASFRPDGGSTVSVKCKDSDCDGYFGEIAFRLQDKPGVVWEVPGEWVVGEAELVPYECPECGSPRVKRKPIHDGLGFYDVKLTCEECGETGWE